MYFGRGLLRGEAFPREAVEPARHSLYSHGVNNAVALKARAAFARRLRSLKDDSEVKLHELPKLEPLIQQVHPHRTGVLPRHGPFHVFLRLWKQRFQQ